MHGELDGVFQVISLIVSLVGVVIVIVLTYYATRWFARRAGAGTGSGRAMRIVDRISVAQGSHLIIVEAGGDYYMLGVSDKSISLITKLDDLRLDANPVTGAEQSFRDILRDMLPERLKDLGKKGNGGDLQ